MLDESTEPPVAAAPAGRWAAAECPFVVEYPAELMVRIRQRAVENFHALPNGGLEVGGVLFGRVLPNARMMQRVELVAERPIECAHASGPAFVLSGDEKAQVAALIGSGRRDREIAGLSVVGFWVAHGRTELALTPDDLDLYRELFSNPWQIVLVLKAQSDGVPRGSFFFRAQGGVAPHRKSHEFFADPNLTETAAEEPVTAETVVAGKYKPIVKGQRGKAADAAQAPAVAVQPRRREVLRKVDRMTVAALLVGALLGFGLRSLWNPASTIKGRAPEMTLELFEAGPELLVHWNTKSWEVDHARAAQLVVESGGISRTLALNVRDLVTGYLRLLPTDGETTVTLRITENDGHTEQQQRFWIPKR